MSIDPRSETRTRASRDPGPASGASAAPHAERRPTGHLARALAVLGASAALAILGGASLGCGSDPADLAAPAGLEAMLAAPGVHLSWEDHSTGEEQFMVMRREATVEYAEIGRVGENVTAFHDLSVRSGTTYTYVVHAMNAGGTSAPSNEATIAVP
ncbi:MAG TPA: fibronectin type III domain-containing protein [Anaeromyxobacteraceae bacterium]|nr:fibronectin type III domain-containing protein [Anaeromyxobacteraceae bacterium]